MINDVRNYMTWNWVRWCSKCKKKRMSTRESRALKCCVICYPAVNGQRREAELALLEAARS